MGEDSFSPFTSRVFSSAPARGCLEHTLGRKTTKKTASYPDYLYTSGGTPPHGLLVPIRLLWLVPAKKAVHFVMRTPCSIIAATLQWPTGIFLGYFTKFENDHSNQLRRETVRQAKNVCQMSFLSLLKLSCFKVLSWRHLKIPAIKFDPSQLKTATQPLNTPTFLWPLCVSCVSYLCHLCY